MFSLSDAKNSDGEWIMSPEQIRAEMAYSDEPPEFDPYEYDEVYDEDDTLDCGCSEGMCYCEPLGMTDVEADADTLRSAGWGTEEDYGYFGDSEFFGEE
jgi:hypothetical protein